MFGSVAGVAGIVTTTGAVAGSGVGTAAGADVLPGWAVGSEFGSAVVGCD